jgi:hypothetical protein
VSKKHAIIESATVTLNNDDFRRAVSALANSGRSVTAMMELEERAARERLKGIADECIGGLAALALAQIRRVP